MSTHSTHELEKSGVVSDVVDSFHPKTELTVTYGHHKVHMGTELNIRDVEHQPHVSWNPEEGAFYTLAKVDPDAPSRHDHKFREWYQHKIGVTLVRRHWVVVNIPENDVSKGDVASSYVGAGPPKGTGFHRYVFLLYKQPGKMAVPEFNDSGMHRASFHITEFAKEHHLGHPLAANFYICKRE